MEIVLPNNKLAEIPRSIGYQLVGDDQIVVSIFSPYETCNARLYGRLMRPDGTVALIEENWLVPITGADDYQKFIPVGNGILFNLSLFITEDLSTVPPVIGRLAISNGSTAQIPNEAVIASGIVTGSQPLIYPPVGGDLSIANGADNYSYNYNALTGAGGTHIPPSGAVEIILGVSIVYVASVVVGNRAPYIQFTTAGVSNLRCYAQAFIIAGTTTRISFFPTGNSLSFNNTQQASMPPGLQVGDHISDLLFSTDGAQAGDTMDVTIYTERHIQSVT